MQGADCNFSHANPHSYKKKELCKFYLSGHCNKGHDCIYMHDILSFEKLTYSFCVVELFLMYQGFDIQTSFAHSRNNKGKKEGGI